MTENIERTKKDKSVNGHNVDFNMDTIKKQVVLFPLSDHKIHLRCPVAAIDGTALKDHESGKKVICDDCYAKLKNDGVQVVVAIKRNIRKKINVAQVKKWILADEAERMKLDATVINQTDSKLIDYEDVQMIEAVVKAAKDEIEADKEKAAKQAEQKERAFEAHREAVEAFFDNVEDALVFCTEKGWRVYLDPAAKRYETPKPIVGMILDEQGKETPRNDGIFLGETMMFPALIEQLKVLEKRTTDDIRVAIQVAVSNFLEKHPEVGNWGDPPKLAERIKRESDDPVLAHAQTHHLVAEFNLRYGERQKKKNAENAVKEDELRVMKTACLKIFESNDDGSDAESLANHLCKEFAGMVDGEEFALDEAVMLTVITEHRQEAELLARLG